MQERARQFDAAAIAAGKLRGLVVGALGKSEPRKFLLDMCLRDCARDAVQAGVEQEIGGDRKLEIERRLLKDDTELRQRRHRIARHVVAHDVDAAGIGSEQAGKQLEQRGLAGAVWAEQGDEFSGLGHEAHAIEARTGP